MFIYHIKFLLKQVNIKNENKFKPQNYCLIKLIENLN